MYQDSVPCTAMPEVFTIPDRMTMKLAHLFTEKYSNLCCLPIRKYRLAGLAAGHSLMTCIQCR